MSDHSTAPVRFCPRCWKANCEHVASRVPSAEAQTAAVPALPERSKPAILYGAGGRFRFYRPAEMDAYIDALLAQLHSANEARIKAEQAYRDLDRETVSIDALEEITKIAQQLKLRAEKAEAALEELASSLVALSEDYRNEINRLRSLGSEAGKVDGNG